MRKKILVIVFILSLISVSVPTPRKAQAAPGQQISFDLIASTVTEGDMVYVTFKTTRSIGPSKYIDVYYAVGGTANVSDYDFNDSHPGVARLTDNELSFPLYSVDEGAVEPNETFIITLDTAIDSDNNNVSIDQNRKVYTHTIQNNNGAPRLSFIYPTNVTNENSAGAVFRVHLSRPAVAEARFQWMFADGFSTVSNQPLVLNGHTFPADVSMPSTVWQNAVIPVGQNFVDIALGLQDDNLVEDNETAMLVIGGSLTNTVLGGQITQVYTITNDDDPTISFSSASGSGQENLLAPVVTVALSKAIQQDLRFSIGADQANSTATVGGVDWSLPAQAVPFTIPAGATSANINFSVVDDNSHEGNETAILSIINVNTGGVDVPTGPHGFYTYTITDNDAPVAPPAPPTPPATPPATPPVVPPGICPALSPGDMIKVGSFPAIYVVNRFNKTVFFPSGDEYKSWNEGEGYGGYTTVTQDCFDNGLKAANALPVGINYRPGSFVIKKENTSQLYAVLPNNTIAKISTADAKALYGTNYKVKIVKFIFWPNYVNTAPDISGKAHSGMLVRKDNKVWYVDGNSLREVTAAGMTANRFKSTFVHTVPASYLAGFNTGSAIDSAITELVNRTQL